MELRAKPTTIKAKARQAAKMSQALELSKQKLLEAIKQGRYSEKKPTSKEIKREKYMDAVSKNPPVRIDEIAKTLGKDPDNTGGILAVYRKLEGTGQVKIIWLKDDPAKLPYIVPKTWLDQQTTSK